MRLLTYLVKRPPTRHLISKPIARLCTIQYSHHERQTTLQCQQLLKISATSPPFSKTNRPTDARVWNGRFQYMKNIINFPEIHSNTVLSLVPHFSCQDFCAKMSDKVRLNSLFAICKLHILRKLVYRERSKTIMANDAGDWKPSGRPISYEYPLGQCSGYFAKNASMIAQNFSADLNNAFAMDSSLEGLVQSVQLK